MEFGSAKPGNISLSERIVEQIIEYIQRTQMQQGDRLPNEKEFMQSLNVSRGTIREAMRSLSSRGIVVIRQGSGTYLSALPGVTVDPFGLDFKYDKKKVLMDLLELRVIMEPSIAAQCARRASPEQVAEIQHLAKQIAECIRRGETHIEMDVAFHCKIAQGTGNDILNVFFPEITKGIRMFTTLLGTKILGDISVDHERIARAIAKRDTQQAYNAMLVHIERNRYALEE